MKRAVKARISGYFFSQINYYLTINCFLLVTFRILFEMFVRRNIYSRQIFSGKMMK